MTNSHESIADDADAEIGRVCSLLASIAKRYPKDSPEYLAIQDAASAYIVVHQRQTYLRAFQRLKAAAGGQLTDEMVARLRQHGIDPDELEHDD